MTDRSEHIPPAASDAELIRQAQTRAGRAAFAALYRRYVTPLYRYFYARTGSPALSEDLTSQTFIAALKGLPRYRERGSFAGWLFTIAARRLADHLRARPSWPLDQAGDLPAGDPLPETVIEQAAQIARLMRAVQALSPDRMQAVSLHFFGELSLQETARVMKRSKVAVKSLINRALSDLRKRLDDEQ